MRDPATSGSYSAWLPAPPERVWGLVTCPVASAAVFHGLSLRSTWQPQSELALVPVAVPLSPPALPAALAAETLHGTVLWAAPATSLSFSIDDGTGTATFVELALRASGDGCVLTLRVDECGDDSGDLCELEDVWLPVLDRLRGQLASS
ncbi:MAG: hypothetical protein ACTHNT_03365 [Actinomycetales bacterium]